MSVQTFELYEGTQITDEIVHAASQLFSENYGVWGSLAPKHIGSFINEGDRVKMSPKKLRKECLPAGADTLYSRVLVDGKLAGNAFACRWKTHLGTVCWITQLVVGKEYRRMGLASGLLRCFLNYQSELYGILTSHPAGCLAAAKQLGCGIDKVNVAFIAEHAESVMKSSPINYISGAVLHGSAFDATVNDRSVASAFTNFFVDHHEPLETLHDILENRGIHWPMGDLLEGHEFVLIFPARQPPYVYRAVSQLEITQ